MKLHFGFIEGIETALQLLWPHDGIMDDPLSFSKHVDCPSPSAREVTAKTSLALGLGRRLPSFWLPLNTVCNRSSPFETTSPFLERMP
jgi:hypothetical protein